MSNIVLFGFPNHTAQAYVTALTTGLAGLEPAEMGAEWLKTEEPSDRARLTTLDPQHSQFGFSTALVPVTIDGIAAVNHNVAEGGQLRFVGWNGGIAGTHNIPTIKPPQTIVSSTNMTGVVGNIDEDVSAPDGLVLAPTDPTLPWSVTLRFFSLTGTVHTGTDMMALVVRVRRLFTGAGATSPSTLPVLTATLAAPSFSLGYRAVTASGSTGQILIFPFARADFTSVTDLQATISFTPGISSSGGQHAVLDVAAVYYDQITANSPMLDSGWMTVETDSRLEKTAPSQHTHYIPPSPWTGVIGYAVQFRADQSIHSPLIAGLNLVPVGAVPRDPDTFVQAGVAPAGRAIIPSVGVRKGSGPMSGVPEVAGFAGATAGGQAFGADSYSYRTTPPLEVILTRDELLVLQDQAGFRRGRSRPFYLAIEPNVALRYQLFTAGWVTLKSIGEPRPIGKYKADGTMKFSVELSFQEKL